MSQRTKSTIWTWASVVVAAVAAIILGVAISLWLRDRSKLDELQQTNAALSVSLNNVIEQVKGLGGQPVSNNAKTVSIAGAQGPIGPAGPQGEVGPSGPVGPGGQPGAQGPVGAQGPIGATGLPGPEGPSGATGAVGPAGPVGADGQPGADGQTGSQGPMGEPGPQGSPGANGADGAQGPPGVSGFPFWFVVGLTRYDCNAPNTQCVASTVIP